MRPGGTHRSSRQAAGRSSDAWWFRPTTADTAARMRCCGGRSACWSLRRRGPYRAGAAGAAQGSWPLHSRRATSRSTTGRQRRLAESSSRRGSRERISTARIVPMRRPGQHRPEEPSERRKEPLAPRGSASVRKGRALVGLRRKGQIAVQYAARHGGVQRFRSGRFTPLAADGRQIAAVAATC